MLRHDDVPHQPKLKFAPDLAQNFQKQISRANRFQVAPPVITAKSKEMQVSLPKCRFKPLGITPNSGPPLQKPQG